MHFSHGINSITLLSPPPLSKQRYCDVRRHAVTLCVCPPSRLYHVSTACRISLGSEGNVLYPVLSGYVKFFHCLHLVGRQEGHPACKNFAPKPLVMVVDISGEYRLKYLTSTPPACQHNRDGNCLTQVRLKNGR